MRADSKAMVCVRFFLSRVLLLFPLPTSTVFLYNPISFMSIDLIIHDAPRICRMVNSIHSFNFISNKVNHIAIRHNNRISFKHSQQLSYFFYYQIWSYRLHRRDTSATTTAKAATTTKLHWKELNANRSYLLERISDGSY